MEDSIEQCNIYLLGSAKYTPIESEKLKAQYSSEQEEKSVSSKIQKVKVNFVQIKIQCKVQCREISALQCMRGRNI